MKINEQKTLRRRKYDIAAENRVILTRNSFRVSHKSINSRTSRGRMSPERFPHSVQGATAPSPRNFQSHDEIPVNSLTRKSGADSRSFRGETARTTDGKLPSAITRPVTKLPLFNFRQSFGRRIWHLEA